MEALPVESWELARPNITTWADDLSAAPNTRDISKARGRVFDLGRRIDVLTRPPFVDVDKITPEPEEDVGAVEEPVGEGEGVEEEEEEEEEEYIENDPIVHRRQLDHCSH